MNILPKSLMNVLPKSLVTALVLVLMVLPVAAMATAVAVPMEKKIAAGTTVITYGGQQLQFTTPIALVLKLEPVSEIEFKLTMSVYVGTQVPRDSPDVDIDWQNRGERVYHGPPPHANHPFRGVFNSESGFTEK